MLTALIKTDRIAAMKAGDTTAKNILTVLVGEIENKSTGGKVLPEEQVISLVKKYILANEEVMRYSPNDMLIKENLVLSKYLPTQMSEVDIETALLESKATDLGGMMKYMKDNYAGKYDGKLASTVAKRLI